MAKCGQHFETLILAKCGLAKCGHENDLAKFGFFGQMRFWPNAVWPNAGMTGWLRGRAENLNVDISGPRRFKRNQNSTKGPQQEGEKNEHCGGRGKKSAKFLGPDPSGPNVGPTLLGPGPALRARVWHPLGHTMTDTHTQIQKWIGQGGLAKNGLAQTGLAQSRSLPCAGVWVWCVGVGILITIEIPTPHTHTHPHKHPHAAPRSHTHTPDTLTPHTQIISTIFVIMIISII